MSNISHTVRSDQLHDKCAEDEHAYNRFGNMQEKCIRCGKYHPLVSAWRDLVTAGVELGLPKRQLPQHPYLSMMVGGGNDSYGNERPEKVAWTSKQMKAYFKTRA